MKIKLVSATNFPRVLFRLIAVVLVLSLLPCITLAGAKTLHEEEGVEPANFFQPSLRDGGGNEYGYSGWKTFAAAQAYYGYDWTYVRCSKIFEGNFYNYFYTFADGLRMYFGVLE